jgi:hypothetical protein
MARLKKLHAPRGTDEANHNGVSYRVDNDGTVLVDESAVGPLLAVGGFTQDDDSDPVPDGLIAASGPAGVDSCSWNGVTYSMNEKGLFALPVASMDDMVSHGFSVVDEPVAEPAKAPKLKIPA